VSETVITNVRVIDLRFPTSRSNIGSDAVNKDPDYSAAYCILETNSGLEGYGLTFTLGRGNELCVLALEYLARFVKGRTLESLTTNMAALCRQLTDDSQFRWLGPEKGVIHLAAGALINAVWDLYARSEKKPLWRLLAELDTEQILSAVEFRYIDDALSREEARAILEQGRTGRQERIDLLLRAPSGQDVACEVKSVGAARRGVALFPDAPTLRGLRHLALLARLARRGMPAALVLCAQRGDVRAIAADESIDPAFARALRAARRAGVAVAGLRCAAHPGGMELLGPVPVL